MYDNFFTGKRILVTGVAGVKGSWLALALLRAGAAVIGLDRRTPDIRSNFCLAGLGKHIEFIKGDVADVDLMDTLVGRVDGVFHLAAVALVREAREHPLDAYRSNTLGVVALLEAARKTKRPLRLVFVTTDKVYRPKGGELWLESDPLVASGPYAVSKACAEFIIADYQRTYFDGSECLVGVGRAGNVVIGGDFYSSKTTKGGGRIFVDCFEALIEKRPPEIFSPSFTRPYTYGGDIISGYMSLMSQLHRGGVAGQAFNFGPAEQYGVSNAHLATAICTLWGGDVMWRSGTPREEPFEFQSLSIQKSHNILGWRPAYTLNDALGDTARWYREWAELENSRSEGSMYDLDLHLLEKHQSTAQRLDIAWAQAGK
jgi:CDP-glucose 4,6-dehydratase